MRKKNRKKTVFHLELQEMHKNRKVREKCQLKVTYPFVVSLEWKKKKRKTRITTTKEALKRSGQHLHYLREIANRRID